MVYIGVVKIGPEDVLVCLVACHVLASLSSPMAGSVVIFLYRHWAIKKEEEV